MLVLDIPGILQEVNNEVIEVHQKLGILLIVITLIGVAFCIEGLRIVFGPEEGKENHEQ